MQVNQSHCNLLASRYKFIILHRKMLHPVYFYFQRTSFYLHIFGIDENGQNDVDAEI